MLIHAGCVGYLDYAALLTASPPDIKIVTENGDLWTHSVVLAALSHHLADILTVSCRYDDDNDELMPVTTVLFLADFPCEVVKTLLRIVCSGQVVCPAPQLNQLISLTELLRVKSMSILVEKLGCDAEIDPGRGEPGAVVAPSNAEAGLRQICLPHSQPFSQPQQNPPTSDDDVGISLEVVTTTTTIEQDLGKKRHLNTCVDCHETFEKFVELKEHAKSVHREKPLKCRQCPMRFNAKLGRDVHYEAKHSGGRHQQCDVCGKYFSTERFMKFHRKQQHELEGKRTVKCEICGSLHLGKANLKKHINVKHKPPAKVLTCPFCPSSFGRKYSYDMHLRVHSGEAPYTCAKCPRTFKRSHHRQKHQEICDDLKEKRRLREEAKIETVELTVIEDTGHITLLENSCLQYSSSG